MAHLVNETPDTKTPPDGRYRYALCFGEADLRAMLAGHPVELRVGLPRDAEDCTFTCQRKDA
jgi:hypothetical protein